MNEFHVFLRPIIQNGGMSFARLKGRGLYSIKNMVLNPVKGKQIPGRNGIIGEIGFL